MPHRIGSWMCTALSAATIIACGSDGTPTAPVVPLVPVPPPTVPSNPKPPPPVLAIFDRVTPSTFNGSSRYVLYKDSTFILEYIGNSYSGSYPGRLARTDSVVFLSFSVNSIAGPWEATAVLRGESLLVLRYNLVMQFSDFEDGEYLKEP